MAGLKAAATGPSPEPGRVVLFTVGHSTRSLEELMAILEREQPRRGIERIESAFPKGGTAGERYADTSAVNR